jgi:histone deacetylase HOS3
MVQAASVSIHGPHGQHIENIHLQQYTSEEHFWEVLYKDHYSKLLSKAEDFFQRTGFANDMLVFIRFAFSLFFLSRPIFYLLESSS